MQNLPIEGKIVLDGGKTKAIANVCGKDVEIPLTKQAKEVLSDFKFSHFSCERTNGVGLFLAWRSDRIAEIPYFDEAIRANVLDYKETSSRAIVFANISVSFDVEMNKHDKYKVESPFALFCKVAAYRENDEKGMNSGVETTPVFRQNEIAQAGDYSKIEELSKKASFEFKPIGAGHAAKKADAFEKDAVTLFNESKTEREGRSVLGENALCHKMEQTLENGKEDIPMIFTVREKLNGLGIKCEFGVFGDGFYVSKIEGVDPLRCVRFFGGRTDPGIEMTFGDGKFIKIDLGRAVERNNVVIGMNAKTAMLEIEALRKADQGKGFEKEAEKAGETEKADGRTEGKTDGPKGDKTDGRTDDGGDEDDDRTDGKA
jgi:hypothetical protein